MMDHNSLPLRTFLILFLSFALTTACSQGDYYSLSDASVFQLNAQKEQFPGELPIDDDIPVEDENGDPVVNDPQDDPLADIPDEQDPPADEDPKDPAPPKQDPPADEDPKDPAPPKQDPPADEDPKDPAPPKQDPTKGIPTKRICWNRSNTGWPTVESAEQRQKTVILRVSKNGETTFVKTLQLGDFYRTSPVLEVPESMHNADHRVQVCHSVDGETCHSGGKYTSTLIIAMTKTRYSYARDMYKFDLPQSLSMAHWDNPDLRLPILVDNMQRRDADKDTKEAFCDEVFKAASPLALDFSGKGFLPSSQEQGMLFDVDVDGSLDLVSSLGSEAGLLALDLNGNGEIDNGRELFGNSTLIGASEENFSEDLMQGFDKQSDEKSFLESLGLQEAANGFVALAQYDLNRDGVIDSDDEIFGRLRVWIDHNNNGVSESEELNSLSSHNVQSLNLNYRNSKDTDLFGNQARQIGHYTDQNDQQQHLIDLWYWIRD